MGGFGSGGSYRGTEEKFSVYKSTDPSADETAAAAERERIAADRVARIMESRARIEAENPVESEVRSTVGLYDRRMVRNRITRPDSSAREITVWIVDNSGSNRVVADRIRLISGQMLATMGIILGKDVQLAIIYGSDHSDGSGYRQDVDFLNPDAKGDRVLYSTTHDVFGASGGDDAEAFECLLRDASAIDFGHVSKEKRHLILVTDVVGHGMGMHDDHGCVHRVDYRRSIEDVYRTYGTFQVIGTGTTERIGNLQRQFLHADRVDMDFLNMRFIRDMEHRLGMISNAMLFLMARNQGTQVAKTFLSFLYEKWLSNPVFGQDTDLRARDAIKQFFQFIEGMTPDLQQEWEEEIFGD